MKLSVAIITFNEEKNIERCLRSLEGIADEILVVDSFSKDATQTICAKYNVRFIQHIFEGHIQQKNYAIDQTSGDWVLSLDADEALDEALRKSIIDVKNSPNRHRLSNEPTNQLLRSLGEILRLVS
jgi:glycosyltransferase involved in cell wall biosynthesis